jgi:orotate phosphoribosyltransferase
VVGTSTAGIPHAAYVSTILNLPMAYVRGKSKDHGRQNNIEGDLQEGMKVVVIEDLLSTGKSCLECVEILRAQNIEVLGVVSIFTYHMKLCDQNFQKAKCVKHSIMDLDTLLEIAYKSETITAGERKQILCFRDDPTNDK